MMKNHPFHLVTNSPWPFILSLNLMNFLLSITNLFYLNNYYLLIMSIMTLIISMYQWWRDVIRESTFQGFHSLTVLNLIKMGMMLFIISELLFFISLFWTYFHSSISPNNEIGNIWPPKNIMLMNPYNIPLLNSIILISSGFTVTWCHNSIMENKFFQSKFSLFMTILLGIYFSLLQIFEYMESSFCFNDSIYGNIFFMTTGFHGTHVYIGTLFLIVSFLRLKKKHFSKIHHFNFEAASWYWHFVDIIWLFVYTSMYWWTY